MKDPKTTYIPTVEAIQDAADKLKGIASVSPLDKHIRFSEKYECNMLFKREDLQSVFYP